MAPLETPWPRWAGGQQEAVLVKQPTVHGVAGVDVLGDRVLHEVAGRNHLDPARCNVGLVDDPPHTTPVVAMGVRIDHGGYRQSLTNVLLE